MKKMMNTLAGYATALVMSIFVMLSVLSLTGCSTGLDDVVSTGTPCNGCDDPNPDPNPEKKVESVDHYGCELLSFDWSYKNAASTRSSEYSVELADGGAFCNSAFRYLADIVYTDGSRQKANEEYNNRSSFVGFGYKNTLYVAAGEAATFENAPEITNQNTSNGVVTFLSWEKKTVAVLANTVNDVTVSWNATLRGNGVNAYCKFTLNDEPITGTSKKLTINESTPTTKAFKLVATYNDRTNQVSSNLYVVGAMHFGFSNESSNANLVLTNLIKQSLKTSPIGTYTLQNLESGNYMWLCVPNNMSINEVTLNGFNVPMEASQDKQQGNITYKCYRSNHALIQGSYKVKIS